MPPLGSETIGSETTHRPYYSQAPLRARLAQRTTLHSYQVPTMVPEFCTKRLICMEYCPGVKISDTAELEKQGFDQALLTMLTMLTRLPTYYLVPWS